MSGTSASESSEIDEEHVVMHDDISDSDDTVSILSITESAESFASANMGENGSPIYLTDPEG